MESKISVLFFLSLGMVTFSIRAQTTMDVVYHDKGSTHIAISEIKRLQFNGNQLAVQGPNINYQVDTLVKIVFNDIVPLQKYPERFPSYPRS